MGPIEMPLRRSRWICPGVQEMIQHETDYGHGATRRSFLLQSGALVATAAALAGVPLSLHHRPAPEPSGLVFSGAQRRLLHTVQAHLLPSDAESPGAADINAVDYVEWAITAPAIDPDLRSTLVSGLERLQNASRERFDLPFDDLRSGEREQLLRYLADNTRWGRAWVSLNLYYLFEALLCDPVYGGNPDEIGWRWLEHQPGFPRPPAEKIYGRL